MCSASQTEPPPCAPPPLRRVGLALGANLGDRLRTLESACDRLCAELCGGGDEGGLRTSRVYETEPVGCPAGSPAYLNACVELYTARPPQETLARCLRIEAELGRRRSGAYGEPRSCDIDLLYHGETELHTPELTLPHPRAHLRRFVLQPLCDIDPTLVLPGQRLSVAELLAQLPPGPGVEPYREM